MAGAAVLLPDDLVSRSFEHAQSTYKQQHNWPVVGSTKQSNPGPQSVTQQEIDQKPWSEAAGVSDSLKLFLWADCR
ncbi:hypothetical protein WJX73_008238 [Symbiochloris irregularis]|uniref:Uncharacterized protein n=1 Tax=Symbiochloris irregularis TaxID=706552 RepID=A0AAW1NRG3_9CHLO